MSLGVPQISEEFLRKIGRKAALLDQLVESNLLLIDRSIYSVDGSYEHIWAVLSAELRALYPPRGAHI